MSESLPQPRELTTEDVVQAFIPVVEQYGPIDPSELPIADPIVQHAYDLYDTYQSQEEARVAADGTMMRTKYDFIITTLLVDAGFNEPDYVADVANDWLVQTLTEAEAAGQSELALQIKLKMFELNKLLPVELREPAAEIGASLEDMLSIEDCAELAAMETGEALAYASTLLIEGGVENPEALLKARGLLE